MVAIRTMLNITRDPLLAFMQVVVIYYFFINTQLIDHFIIILCPFNQVYAKRFGLFLAMHIQLVRK